MGPGEALNVTQELAIKYRQEDITPFWQKLPFFFLFPFRFGPVVFMACLVAASALAGLALGSFGLVLRGFLVYLGLRYAFNVLDLFAKGRFEGESPDHKLWGPEKRPAKLGLVITLFLVLAINIGNIAVDARLQTDLRAQDLVVDRFRRDHAAELADIEKQRARYQEQAARQEERAAAIARLNAAREGTGQEDVPAVEEAPVEAADPVAAPRDMPTREEMLETSRPRAGDAMWFRLLPAWYWVLVAMLSIVLPAAAIVIALEDAFFKALNPGNVVHLVQCMGSAYFVLWGFFLAIAGSRQLVFHAGAHWPPALRQPLEMAVATYLGLVLFAIMGYALYQFHQELHLDVDVDFDEHREAGGAEAIASAGSARAALRATRPEDPFEARLQALQAEGKVAEAIAEVKDRMRYDRFDAALNTRLHALYAVQGDRDAMLVHGQQWLGALARAGQPRELLAALRKLLAIDTAFVVEDGHVILPAAGAAMQQADFDLAASLVRGFDRRFPAHKDTPGVYFLGARLLSEQARQHEKAANILRTVLARFPEHPVCGEARTYLTVLEAMTAGSLSA
jgi:tetratricopeptide (TPR) repeat protein